MADHEPRDTVAAVPPEESALDNPALHDPAAIDLPPDAVAGAAGALDISAGRIRRENLTQLLRSAAFIVGAVLFLWWVFCAVFGYAIAPYNPVNGSLVQFNLRTIGRSLVRHRLARPGRVLPRCSRGPGTS